MVETGWSVIEPIQEVWQALPGHFPNYPAGTWGPAAADALIARDGREWGATEEPEAPACPITTEEPEIAAVAGTI